MKGLLLLLAITSSLFGEKILTVATYNVENLFDLEKSGYEYKEYIPNSSSEWNQKTYKIKLQNIARVIKDMGADIIALQEIESLKALLDLRFTLKREGLYYEHYAIADKKNTTVKVALLSRLPFVYSKELSVAQNFEYRNILETKFNINGTELYIFVNHWKAKSGPESQRIISAKALKRRVQEIGYDKNIILLGDFNSDYEEHVKFIRKRNLNDTDGITGINHILGTINQRNYVKYLNYMQETFYNLWYDADEENRYSYIYKGKKEVLDNIIVSQALLNDKEISYISPSISTFSKEYMYKKGSPHRWEITKARVQKHKGKGYSDHLPVVAKFKVE